jgi:hypothetical protein
MDIKHCAGCGLEKPLSDFNFRNKRKGLRQYYCRDCTREQVQAHYEANVQYYVLKAARRKAWLTAEHREWLINYLLLHPCVDCGEKDLRCLDFDHVRGQKRTDISLMVGRSPWDALEEEIAKCEVRCANCHRQRTAERRSQQSSIRKGKFAYL